MTDSGNSIVPVATSIPMMSITGKMRDVKVTIHDRKVESWEQMVPTPVFHSKRNMSMQAMTPIEIKSAEKVVSPGEREVMFCMF